MHDVYATVRERAGLFDLSVALFEITGADALEALDRAAAGNIPAMNEGQIVNTALLNHNGTIAAIVWIMKDDGRYLLFTDEEKRDEVEHRLSAGCEGLSVERTDVSRDMCCVTIIGPQAQEVARELAGDDIVGLQYHCFERNEALDALVARVGYTGEYEYRIIAPASRRGELMATARVAGERYGMEICESGGLSLLMLEMKSVNQLIDLDGAATPLQAGLHWMVHFAKKDYAGREAVMEEKGRISRKLTMLMAEQNVQMSPGDLVVIEDGAYGKVVNAGWSPTLKRPICLAYVDAELAWVGVRFEIATATGKVAVKAVSAPLFITRTVSGVE